MKHIFLTLFVACFVITSYGQVENMANAVDTRAVGSLESDKITLVLEPVNKNGGKPLMEALSERKTERKISSSEIDLYLLGQLLWAANGVNRVEENKKTVPSARNIQEINVYVFKEDGIWAYKPQEHQLLLIEKSDHRKDVSNLPFVASSAVVLVMVADYDKMKNFSTEDKIFYSAIDCGYVCQNVYLFAASENLATVTIGQVNRDAVAKLLHIKNGKVIVAQPIGYAK